MNKPQSLPVKPWIFSLLILPQGIYLGLVSLVLPFTLAHAGVSVDRISHVTSLLSLPWIAYFLWAPLVDFALSRRTWLLLATACAACSVSVSLLYAPAGNLPAVMALGFIGAFAASLVIAACGGLMLNTLTIPQQGIASSWYEAGKLAGTALGGAAILWFLQPTPTFSAALLSGLLVATPLLAVLSIHEPASSHSTSPLIQQAGFSQMFRQFRTLFSSPKSSSSLVLLASPVGVGAAFSLLPAIAKSYGVGADGVILTNGIAGGLIMALGSLAGTLFPKSWDRRFSYALAGFANAAAVLILLSGKNPLVYFLGTILYLGTTGLCWARYAALVAETAGPVGPIASTRFSVVAILGNIPLAYMIWLDGLGYRNFGVNGLLEVDAGANLAGLALVALLIVFYR